MAPLANQTHLARNGTTADLSASLAKPASYTHLYFAIHGLGGVSREILSYGGAKWESRYPTNWNVDRGTTPFFCLPVLTVHTEDGRDITLSEAQVVDNFLAKKYDLLGDNEYESNLINMFYSSSATVQNQFAVTVTWNFAGPEAKKQSLDMFLNRTLSAWIESHERHLIDNGSNGHYVGDRLSLADIRTAYAIEHFLVQPESEVILKKIKESAVLYKVYETVAKNPKIAAWRESDEFKKLGEMSRQFFINPMANIPNEP